MICLHCYAKSSNQNYETIARQFYGSTHRLFCATCKRQTDHAKVKGVKAKRKKTENVHSGVG